MNVGDKDHLDIAFAVKNKKEKAYQAALYLQYDPEELELPTLTGEAGFSGKGGQAQADGGLGTSDLSHKRVLAAILSSRTWAISCI